MRAFVSDDGWPLLDGCVRIEVVTEDTDDDIGGSVLMKDLVVPQIHP